MFKNFLTYLSLVFIGLTYLVTLHYRDGIQAISYDLFGLGILALSVFSLLCWSIFFHHLFGMSKRLYGLLFAFVCTFYSLLFLYHYRAKTNFSYSVVADNWGEAFSLESFNVMKDMFKLKDFYQVFAIFAVIILAYYFPKLYRKRKLGQGSKVYFALAASFLGASIVFNFPSYDELTSFCQSVFNYYRPHTIETALYRRLDETKRPFLYSYDFSHEQLTATKPHLFVIAMESFSSDYLNRSLNGVEVTPFMNQLIKKSVYFPHFYSNSIQTAKGHFAINCSLLPMIRDKAFYQSDKLNLNCLPQVLKEYNYRTVFFQGFGDPHFDQTDRFALKNGFDDFLTADSSLLTAVERKEKLWGWGIQDDLAFQQFFSFWDKKVQEGHRPLFSFIATISHHMRFRDLPRRYWDVYPDANGDKEKSFVNSLHTADRFLSTFFDELKKRGIEDNSIVILVGDHGYPNGQHGNFHSETRFYNESFAVPLVLFSPKLLRPKVVEGNFSQIDIAPTILQILGLKGEQSMIGRSVLSGEKRFSHLIQPYDGTYLATVWYPYKYVLHLRTKREFLFDLKRDPSESQNIIDVFNDDLLLQKLRDQVGIIFLNNELLKNAANRL